MKRITSLVFAITISCFLLVPNVSAINNPLSITIPQFKVTVNDRDVNSRVMKYPLIVYNDITYFPLTWEWCSELGLASAYTKEEGLYIANYISQSQDVLDGGGSQAAGSKHYATIPTYPVYINGQQIDNTKEKYPLLNFRGITYFPLTWDFVVDEFGWEESWDSSFGLKISSEGDLTEHLPGSHYKTTSSYILESYRDYAIIESFIEERSISAQPNKDGVYSNNYEGKSYKYYKLDYKTNIPVEIKSKETKDAPYQSGAVKGEDVGELFTSKNGILLYKGSTLLDLSTDAGIGNSIDKVYASKHTVNGMKIYLTSVLFTQDGISIPAPYTPIKYYVFIDNGDNTLQHLNSWPTEQILSDIYPYGKDGIYLSSKGQVFGSGRYNNGRGMVSIVNSNLSVTTLNDRWEDWNSVDAIGTDDVGNLYLLNTWFPNFDSIDAGSGLVSPINDGYFRLDLKGKLTKIKPFIYGSASFVTPSGQIYINTGWNDDILHLQSNTRIMID